MLRDERIIPFLSYKVILQTPNGQVEQSIFNLDSILSFISSKWIISPRQVTAKATGSPLRSRVLRIFTCNNESERTSDIIEYPLLTGLGKLKRPVLPSFAMNRAVTVPLGVIMNEPIPS